MKLGILVPLQRHANADFVRAYGETAESVGFDSLWIGEHVVITDDYASKFVVDLGDDKMHHKSAEDNVELDIFSTLTFLAAVTNKIRLGSGIAVLPQRNPVYMAKEAGNVDWLSNGRFDFGVGMGWLREEFEVVNAPFERRGARTDSYLEVVKRLWCDDVSEYHGEFYDMPACRFHPKPVQKPHPPIVFAGNSEKSFRRVANGCQGWFGIGYDPEGLAPQIQGLEAALKEANRPREEVTVYASPFGHDYDHKMIEHYRDIGVDHLILLHFADDVDEMTALLHKLADEYLDFCHNLE
jgi:probable F420-dependent oxidoreductase